jgi:hypothetical protein
MKLASRFIDARNIYETLMLIFWKKMMRYTMPVLTGFTYGLDKDSVGTVLPDDDIAMK